MAVAPFTTTILTPHHGPTAAGKPTDRSAKMERPVFVARERELEQLASFLDRALAGQGAVCFVTGEAGSGKTTLVTEFARRAQERRNDVVMAVGQSDAQTGVGDAYLPFREVLGQLTGDVEAELARGAITQENAARLRGLLHLSGQALVEVGPDLVGLFVPGVGLALRMAGFVAGKVGWLEKLERLTQRQRQREGGAPAESGIEQSHIFEQYTNVLMALAAKQPLVLVLDDLQWADGATIDLLFRLGRRIGESRILIVGTYRPDEVAVGRAGERHPLEKVLAEFKRYFGDIWVDLEKARKAEGELFVDALVDTEPNRLGEGFRQALYHHTGGHPLFTVELLRDLQERGDLARDEQGRWLEGPVLDWKSLPARVEGVIEERIGRLEEGLRAALSVGSVEGEDFTAEVLAAVLAKDARGLIRRLSGELEKKHRLVSARGVQRVGGRRLSLYQFQHNLIQAYLYSELDEVELAVLHEDVGTVLEELYGDQAEGIVVQLARHFEKAGITEKARTYLRQAGEQASARYANDEALDFFDQALQLTEADQMEERFCLLMARERIWAMKGDREACAQDLTALETLAEALDSDQRRAEVALRRGSFAARTSDHPAAMAAAQMAVRLSQATQDSSAEAAGRQQWGQALFHQGEYEAARNQLERALSLARAGGSRRTDAASLLNLGTIALSQGDWADARQQYEQSLTVSREIGYRRVELRSLNNLAIVCGEQGDYALAERYYRRTLRGAHEIGDRSSQGMALNNLGVHFEEQGDYSTAMSYYEQALAVRKDTGDPSREALTLMNVARVLAKQGEYGRSMPHYQRCLDLFRQIENRQEEAEALAFLSLLCHQLGEDEAALKHGQRALDIAQQLGDRNAQAYPLTYVGHALVGLDRLAEAADAYRQAVDLRREFGQPHMAMEPLAGLARVSLAQNDLALAQTRVGEILGFLEGNSLDGTEEPFRVYLTCYRVLQASQDPRTQVLLADAHNLLQGQAAKIGDEALRRSFLGNVTANREIVREFARTQ
jgi:predicted ATPase